MYCVFIQIPFEIWVYIKYMCMCVEICANMRSHEMDIPENICSGCPSWRLRFDGIAWLQFWSCSIIKHSFLGSSHFEKHQHQETSFWSKNTLPFLAFPSFTRARDTPKQVRTDSYGNCILLHIKRFLIVDIRKLQAPADVEDSKDQDSEKSIEDTIPI